MGLALRRIKVYSKLGAIIAVAVVLLILIVKNKGNTADVWLFHRFEDVNVLYLILITAVVAVLLWWIVRRVFKIIRDVQEFRRESKERKVEAEHQRRQQELSDQERRIDEKLRRSISDES